jgi:heme exporter protein A
MQGSQPIKVTNLIKCFGLKTVLNNLDFSVEPGESVALIGPNGAGKTTLLRILSSLSRPTSGEVLIAGFQLPRQAIEARRTVGVVSHQPWLYGDLTAEQNLRFYGRMYGVYDLENRIDTMLSMVGLVERRAESVRTFSHGMQQRLTIGRAMLHDPEIILFDEPHTGLDENSCQILNDLLKNIAMLGRSVVVTSHDLMRVENLVSRFDVLWHGRIVASTSSAELEPDQLPTFYRRAIQEA